MAYELGIESQELERIVALFKEAGDGAVAMADSVDKVNRSLGGMKTVSGRVVALPSNPMDGGGAPLGTTAQNEVRTQRGGPTESVMPWAGGARSSLGRERRALELINGGGDEDLIRDQQDRVMRAMLRVERSDRDLASRTPFEGERDFVGPARGSKPRAPFEGELDFVGPTRALAEDPDRKPSTIRGGRTSSIDPYGYEGPRQQLRRFEAMRDRASGMDDPALLADWDDRVSAATRRVKRLENDPDQARLDMFMTSRILPGGKLSPLVNRVLAAGGTLATADGSADAANALKSLGIGQAANLAPAIAEAAKAALPMLMGGGLVAAAGAAVFGVAQAGDASLRKANQAFYTMGGDPENVGAAMALGGDGASQKAMGLADALHGGSYGAAYLRSRGIQDFGSYTVDKSSNYVRALDALRGVDDVQQRIRIARDTGLSEDMWTSDLSDNDYNRLKASRGMAGTPQARRAEAQHRARMEEAGNYWEQLKQAAGGPAMRAISDPLGALEGHSEAWGRLARTTLNLMPGGDAIGRALDVGQDYFEGRQKLGSKGRSATTGRSNPGGWDTSTDRQVADGPETLNGSISGAVPAGWRGRMLSDALANQQVMVGGFMV